MPDSARHKSQRLQRFYDACGAIAATLQEIDEAVTTPAAMQWFREQVHVAAKSVPERGQIERRLNAAREEHARRILKDLGEGHQTFTSKQPPKEGGPWERDSAVVSDESGGTQPVGGWFPVPDEELPKELEDTTEGNAALLAMLHDFCLCDVLEPENDLRIVEDPTDRDALRPLTHLFLAWRRDADHRATPDRMARRWENVRRKMEHELPGLREWEGAAGGKAEAATAGGGPADPAATAGGDRGGSTRLVVSEAEAGSAKQDVPDGNGYVVSPSDPTAYVPASEIVSKHTPTSIPVTSKELPGILEDFATNRVKWTRPPGKDGKPRSNRRNVHLTEWLDYIRRRERAGIRADGDDWPVVNEGEIAERASVIRGEKLAGK